MHDVVDALNTLEVVIKGNENKIHTAGIYLDRYEGYGIVGAALSHLGVSDQDLILLGPLRIDYLYERDLSPLPLTLGGMLVYRAAQRTQDGLIGADRSWGAAFDNAVRAASRVFDLLPDSAVAAAHGGELVYA